jgi:hypothetical protein
MQKCRGMGMKDEYINRINRQRKAHNIQKEKPVEPMPQKYRIIIEGMGPYILLIQLEYKTV